MQLPSIGPEADKLGQKIKHFYFGSKKVELKTLGNEFADLMTDYHFLTSQTKSNELHAKFQNKY